MTAEPSAASEPLRRPGTAGGDRSPAGLDWVTRLPSSAAPGYIYLAGAVRGTAVGGGGCDEAEAAGRLAGEAAEALAQLADPVGCDDPGDGGIDAMWTRAPAPLRVRARVVGSGARLGVPAAAIFMNGRAAEERACSAPPPSVGIGAGRDAAAARLAALLELVERDAAAAWWCEGAAPRQLDAAVAAPAAERLAAMRAGAALPRATAFLDLGSPTGVPVVAALSRDPDGRGLAVGLKAALSQADAAHGAMIELLQMELALEIARHRAARGATVPGDRGPLARAALVPGSYAAFAALPPIPATPPPDDGFEGLATRLASAGQVVVVADLPAAGDLAVAKILAPGLRPLPGGPRPPRPESPGAVAPLI